jgi:hypothetical protein
MAFLSLANLEKVAGPGFGGAGTETGKKILQELQGISMSYVAGFTGDSSAALSSANGSLSASAAGGDTILGVLAIPSAAGLPVDLTGSSSISNDRILIADTSSANKILSVLWINRDGA